MSSYLFLKMSKGGDRFGRGIRKELLGKHVAK
jgi:hypothetical protein